MLIAFVILAMLLSAGPDQTESNQAESHKGEIRGMVWDSGHHPVAEARIRAQRISGNSRYETLTAADGSFRIGNLSPGTYRLFAEKQALPKSPAASFELSGGQKMELDLILGAPALHSGFFSRLAHAYAADWKNGGK